MRITSLLKNVPICVVVPMEYYEVGKISGHPRLMTRMFHIDICRHMHARCDVREAHGKSLLHSDTCQFSLFQLAQLGSLNVAIYFAATCMEMFWPI